jgi:hypothetical protein
MFPSIEELAAEDRRGWSGAALSARVIEAAQGRERYEAEFVRLVGEWDDRQAWAEDLAVTPAGWLAQQTAMTRVRAQALVRTARLARDHDRTGKALAAGDVSTAHVEQLGRAARDREDLFAEHEDVLIDAAKNVDPEGFRRVARRWQVLADDVLATKDAAEQFERRRLYCSRTSGGTVLDGWLDPELGARVLAALEAADTGPDPAGGPLPCRSLAQRQADALGVICDHYLGCGELPDRRQFAGDVVIDVDTLSGRAPSDLTAARCDLDRVGPIARETALRLCCDALIGRAVVRGRSEVLDLGRRTPVVSDAQRRAVRLRDEHCRFPGCDRPWQWCDVHHGVPVSEGGRTDLNDLHLLCRRHHVCVHEGGWSLIRGPDGAVDAIPP